MPLMFLLPAYAFCRTWNYVADSNVMSACAFKRYLDFVLIDTMKGYDDNQKSF